jgi:hypothetical protein
MAVETFFDGLVLLGIFMLRVGVPLAIVLVIGHWLEKRLAPPSAGESAQQNTGARILSFTPRQNRVPQVPPAAKDESAKRTHVR